MLIALRLAISRFFAGQAFTHTPQPVQSSGATWIRIFMPGYSLPFQSAETKSFGPAAACLASNAFLRMAVWGQTSEQMPHWMHTAGSQTGESKAMRRFSYCVVA